MQENFQTLVMPLSDPTFRSYLVEALINWCEGQNYTPYASIAVDDSCEVPREYVNPDKSIVLCIASYATNKFELTDDEMKFQARFGERVCNVSIPLNRIAAIYPKENVDMVSYFPVTETKLASKTDATEVFEPTFTKL